MSLSSLGNTLVCQQEGGEEVALGINWMVGGSMSGKILSSSSSSIHPSERECYTEST